MNNKDNVSDLYADVIACFFSLASALEKKGTLTRQEFAESCQEKLLTLTVDQTTENPFVLLRVLSTELPKQGDWHDSSSRHL